MKKVKILAMILIVVLAVAALAACDQAKSSSDKKSSDQKALAFLSREDIEHIVGYCATFTQEKGTEVWWECRYYEYFMEEFPESCLELSVIPDDGTEEIEHQCVDFMYICKDKAAAERFVEMCKQGAQEDDYYHSSQETEYLVDGNHVYITRIIYGNGPEPTDAVTPEEQREFYTQKVQKATLPSTFSKQRFDFIIESMTNQFYFSLDLEMANEYVNEEYSGESRIETYEIFSSSSVTYLGTIEEYLHEEFDKAYQGEYFYWAGAKDPTNLYFGVEEDLAEIRQNGNTKDKYIDVDREEGYTFVLYKYNVQEMKESEEE